MSVLRLEFRRLIQISMGRSCSYARRCSIFYLPSAGALIPFSFSPTRQIVLLFLTLPLSSQQSFRLSSPSQSLGCFLFQKYLRVFSRYLPFRIPLCLMIEIRAFGLCFLAVVSSIFFFLEVCLLFRSTSWASLMTLITFSMTSRYSPNDVM